MKNVILFFLVFCLITSCAPIRVKLDGCRNLIYLDQVSKEDEMSIDQRSFNEVSVENLTIFSPSQIQLNKLLLEKKQKCSDLKKVEIEIQERFGLFNKIILRF